MNLIQGNVIGTGMKVAIVASRFNEFIVNKLLAGAEDGSWLKAEDTTR